MATYSSLSTVLDPIDSCRHVESLIQEHKLILDEYDLAGYEADKNCLVAEDDYHDAYMKALWAVAQMLRIRIEKLGGQLPEHGA